jgi:hypothetical protein
VFEQELDAVAVMGIPDQIQHFHARIGQDCGGDGHVVVDAEPAGDIALGVMLGAHRMKA